MHTVNVLCSFG